MGTELIFTVFPLPPSAPVKWQILDNANTIQASGILVANANSTSNTISIYTYDNNMDNRLSAGDTLRIWDLENRIQSGWKFRLLYTGTNGVMGEITLI